MTFETKDILKGLKIEKHKHSVDMISGTNLTGKKIEIWHTINHESYTQYSSTTEGAYKLLKINKTFPSSVAAKAVTITMKKVMRLYSRIKQYEFHIL